MPRRSKLPVWLFSALLLLYGSYCLYLSEQGNFHAITPGEAYRSAQLDRDELEHYIKKYKIKSILCLRNDTNNGNAAWYKEEVKVGAEHGIAHYFVPISSRQEPEARNVAEILRIFHSAPRPILIHCKAGADRTGLAAAMWKVSVDKETKTEAAKQLSLRFFHLPAGDTAAMDRFFEKWEP